MIRDCLLCQLEEGILQVRGGLEGSAEVCLTNSRIFEIYGEVRTGQYDSGETKRRRAEVQNALETSSFIFFWWLEINVSRARVIQVSEGWGGGCDQR